MHLTIFGEVAGFLLYGFPEEKHCVHCLLCLIAVLVILSVKDPNNASLNVEKLTKAKYGLLYLNGKNPQIENYLCNCILERRVVC